MKVKCHICKNISNNLTKLKSVSLHFCNGCKHRFTDVKTIINPEKYKPEYFSSTHSNWFENPDYVLYKNLTEFFKKKFKRKFSVLDIGCGNGNFLKYLSKNIKEISLTGIDHHKNKKHQRINFLQGNINVHLQEHPGVSARLQAFLGPRHDHLLHELIHSSVLAYLFPESLMDEFG